MLLDAIKQKEKEKQIEIQQEIEKYNQPYKRDTIFYFPEIHIIGGIESVIENLSSRYEFSVLYEKEDKERLKYFNDLGIETIKYVGQPIECDTLLRVLYGDAEIKAKKRKLFIHGMYYEKVDIPEHDEIYACSKTAAEQFEKVTGLKVDVLYNPIELIETTKPLIIGVFSRLSSEKGKWRYKYLIDKLKASNKPFLMLIFTDFPFEEDDKRVIMMNPVMNDTEWMKKCDYIANLSNTEAGSITMQKALKLGIPLIVTKLEILDEFKIDKTNAKILEMDMSNLDIDDLWNIPKVKWNEPISKEWEDIMKKKVFRERNEEPKKELKIEKEEIKKEAKEETKKKTTKKVK